MKQASKQARKTREAKPPAKFVRSTSGTPAKVRRTTLTNERGQWLYRLDYGNVVGHGLWTLDSLTEAGVRWLRIKPRDLPVRAEVLS